jgi:hypothetical protein
MPASADTSATIPATFEKIDGTTVGLQLRFLSRRQSQAMRRAYEAIRGLEFGKDDDAIFDGLRTMLELVVADRTWDWFEENLSDEDIFALAVQAEAKVKLTEIELGKSRSRRLTVTATTDSAPTAPAVDAGSPGPAATSPSRGPVPPAETESPTAA